MIEKLALVVEDAGDLREFFAQVLKDAGFQVTKTHSVDTAREALEQQVPDVVILDLNLPGGSGRDILKTIREDPRLTATKVVITTAYPDDAVDLHEKADLVLVKPVGYRQLQDLVARLTGWKTP